MGQDIVDQFRGVRDVNLCTHPHADRVNSDLFNTFIIKKKLSYYINDVSKKKKRLEHVLRPVSLSNSIWYAKHFRAIRPNNKLSCRINVPSVILIIIPLVLPIISE